MPKYFIDSMENMKEKYIFNMMLERARIVFPMS